MQRTSDGKGVFALAIIAWAAMAVFAFYGQIPYAHGEGEGICLSQPSAWNLLPWASWSINIGVLLLMAFCTIILNRAYNFIPTTRLLFATAFLLMVGANPIVCEKLNSSTLLGAANLFSIGMLLGSRKNRNSSATLFIVASTLSIGSMFHYSFLLYIVVYALCAALLKMFNWKALLATLMGIFAPYWIGIGLGLIDHTSLHVPSIVDMWSAAPPTGDEILVIVAIAFTALWGLLIGLGNAFSMATANTSVRMQSYCITLPGIATLILMAIDYGNFMVYYVTLCLLAAFEAGYLSIHLRKRLSLVYWLFFIIYGGLFALMLLV